ncbi:MAG: alpha-ketoglutarate-dependent dioxygenase AlkB [Proteobacteria bacterium]|nr:alpha-ketoglutarate-dependent dioxygenase AlkB [Pseudomonadota bacterium]
MPTGKLPLPSTEAQRFDLPDADLCLWSQAFAADEADEQFSALRSRIEWRQEDILIFGERRRVPRLVAWHGDPGTTYTYSGTAHEPLPWTVELQSIRARVEALSGYRYNSVLLNLYRDGRDGMGWHADDESELGRNPVIASVSLGAIRRFCLRHRGHKDLQLDLLLPHGSLLCMGGSTQHHWVHALPKTRRPVGERINLTFRLLVLR